MKETVEEALKRGVKIQQVDIKERTKDKKLATTRVYNPDWLKTKTRAHTGFWRDDK